MAALERFQDVEAWKKARIELQEQQIQMSLLPRLWTVEFG